MSETSYESLVDIVESLQAELIETKVRLAALEAERSAPRPQREERADRRSFLRLAGTGLAATAGAVVASATSTAPAAAATDDPVLAGRTTQATGTARTAVGNSSGTTLQPVTFQASNDTTLDSTRPSAFRIALAGTTTGADASNGTFKVGVYGESIADDRGVAVYAHNSPNHVGFPSNIQIGVLATCQRGGAGITKYAGYFIAGGAGNSVGVRASSASTAGIGVQASGTVAVEGIGRTAFLATGAGGGSPGMIRQVPAAATGAPTFAAFKGEQMRDSAGDLYLCVADGTPGTWRRVAAQHPSFNTAGGPVNLLPNPIRVVDTRNAGAQNNNGQRLAPNADVAFQITGVGPGGGVPAGAKAVLGNVTAVEPSGGGFLSLFPTAFAGTSNLNYIPNQNLANSFLCALDGTGKLRARSGVSSTHLIVDIAGFLF